MIQWIVALGIFVVNLQLIPKGIFGGDSAEFSYVAELFSIPHPPGYPFYSLLLNTARIFLPFIDSHTRNSLLSLIPYLISFILLTKILFFVTRKYFFSLVASLYVVFLFPVWLYSIVPEAFSLFMCLALAITYSLILYSSSRRYIHLFIACLFFGLSIAHHHTVIFFLPGWLLLLNYQKKHIHKTIAHYVFPILVGVSFYLYVPVSHYLSSVYSVEESSLSGFVRLFFRVGYGTFKAYSNSTNNFQNQTFNLGSVLIFLLQDYKPIGLLFIIAGFTYLYRKQKNLFFLILAFGLPYCFFLFLTNFYLDESFVLATFERFLIGFYIILSVPFAFGLITVYDLLLLYIKKILSHPSLRRFALFSVRAFFVSLVGILFIQNIRTLRYVPQIQTFDRFAMDILDTPPKNAVVTIQGDTPFFSSYYYYFYKKRRPDLFFVQAGLLYKKHYREFLKTFYKGKINVPDSSDFSKFITANSQRQFFNNVKLSSGIWFPYGLLWKYYPSQKDLAADMQRVKKINEMLWEEKYIIPQLNTDMKKILYLQSVQKNYLDMRLAYALSLITANSFSEAQEILQEIIKVNPSHTDSLISLVGLYGFTNKCPQAVRYFEALPLYAIINDMNNTEIIQSYITSCHIQSSKAKEVEKAYSQFKQTKSVPLKDL